MWFILQSIFLIFGAITIYFNANMAIFCIVWAIFIEIKYLKKEN